MMSLIYQNLMWSHDPEEGVYTFLY